MAAGVELPTLILFVFQSALYLVVIFQALRRRAGQEGTAYLLGLYVFTAMLLQSVEALWLGGRLSILSETTFAHIQLYGVLVLALLLVFLVRSFPQLTKGGVWFGVGTFAHTRHSQGARRQNLGGKPRL